MNSKGTLTYSPATSIPIYFADELSQTLNSSLSSLMIEESNYYFYYTDEAFNKGAFETSPMFSEYYYYSSTDVSKKHSLGAAEEAACFSFSGLFFYGWLGVSKKLFIDKSLC